MALFRAARESMEVEQMENHLALAYLANGNIDRASELAHDARQAATERGDERLAAHLADTEALIALEGGDADAAVELAAEAILLATRTGNDRAVTDALVTRGRAYAALGRNEEASADFERAAAARPERRGPPAGGRSFPRGRTPSQLSASTTVRSPSRGRP
jgi:tetratricopeptide (TPR) repeat protein